MQRPNFEAKLATGIASNNLKAGNEQNTTVNGLDGAVSLLLHSHKGRAAVAEALLCERDARLVLELGGSQQQYRKSSKRNESAWHTVISHLVLDLQSVSNERDLSREEVQRLTQVHASFSEAVQTLRTELVGSDRKGGELWHTLNYAEAERDRLAGIVATNHAKLSSQRADLFKMRSQLKGLHHELAVVHGQLQSKQEQATHLLAEKHFLEEECSEFWSHHGTKGEDQLRTIALLEVTMDKLNRQMEFTKSKLSEQRGGMSSLQSQIGALEMEVANAQYSRRELHNEIQELKGNIRVCCRVRPAKESSEAAVQFAGGNKLVLDWKGEHFPFTLDHVFHASAGQADIFAEVDGLVQSALDGHKVCIFAYGQTGSGKTYTMLGQEEPTSRGLIPRSLDKMLEISQSTKCNGWEWSLQVSFIEVYNEVLRDLLRSGESGDAAGGPSTAHTILHDDAWGTVVTNMTCVEVSSMEQMHALMARAMRQRAVSSTDMNATSSRSHTIFAMYLKGTNQELNTQLHGALHLVDLAGSERLNKSGATGFRLKETQNINKSLSSLADVFVAKAEGRSHIPFRNSKLTHLMEPCLSGQGKTLLLVHVGQEKSNAPETLCALRFAKQVSQCDTGGKPKRSARGINAAKAPSAIPPPCRSSFKQPIKRVTKNGPPSFHQNLSEFAELIQDITRNIKQNPHRSLAGTVKVLAKVQLPQRADV